MTSGYLGRNKFTSIVVRVESLRQLQSQTQEELDVLLPSHRDAAQSVLRPQGGAFRGMKEKQSKNTKWFDLSGYQFSKICL